MYVHTHACQGFLCGDAYDTKRSVECRSEPASVGKKEREDLFSSPWEKSRENSGGAEGEDAWGSTRHALIPVFNRQ